MKINPKAKIAIVEDEEFLLEMYKMKFKDSGYEVITAMNGEEAVRKIKDLGPDFILLDIVMPDMDGYEVLRHVKADKKTAQIPVLIFSNLGQKEEVKKGMELGANDYVVKSNLTPTQLLDKVEKMLSTGKKNNRIKKEPDSRAEQDAPRVLLIEDEGAIVGMYKMRFEKAGYEIEVARNGAWGLKLAKEKKFDVVVLDMVMPAMNGYEVLRELKKNKNTKDIPVLVFSNSAQDTEIAKAKKIGAAGYFLKSKITPAQVVSEVNSVIKAQR
jgi:CheY-like chemotaxis protein